MSRTLLHDWECSIEKNKNNTEELLKIAEDIYNTAYIRGKASEERPKGYWDKINYGDYESPDIAIRCSECLEEVDEESDFCPHCGCEMLRPNCVTCDHFGKCDGCERSGEE